ncbi:muconolactone delta-isomerase [Prauserella marina]|nr:muconolactone delta-isomerase [Prauserella marina]
MTVRIPSDLNPEVRADLVAKEKEYARRLQREGEWLHLWRHAGKYANLSVFDVADNERLHEVLWNLPLFPYLEFEITPLAKHPSALA